MNFDIREFVNSDLKWFEPSLIPRPRGSRESTHGLGMMLVGSHSVVHYVKWKNELAGLN